MAREEVIAAYFFATGSDYDIGVPPPRLARFSSSQGTSDSDSSVCSSGSGTLAEHRNLFRTYWERRGKKLYQNDFNAATNDKDVISKAENDSVTGATQPHDKNVSTKATVPCSERRKIFSAYYCANENEAQKLPSKNGRLNACSTTQMFANTGTSSTTNYLSSPSRSINMKTYPQSSFKVARKTSLEGSLIKRGQSISFNPNIHVIEFKKEEEESTSSNKLKNWLFWLQ